VKDGDAIDLLEKMFQLNPSNRISIRDVQKHIYLNDQSKPPCKLNELPDVKQELERLELILIDE
jgi:serine/threonine protein kinase